MTSSNRSSLGWKKPPEWDRFENAVEDEWGMTVPYCGFVLEQAWREYRDRHRLEDHADDLLRAAGRPRQEKREKNFSREAAGDTDERVWFRIHEDVKDDMARKAAEMGAAKHEVLRAVVNWYLEGGLIGRVTQKFDRVVDDAVDSLEGRDGDGRPGPVERRTRTLCRILTGDTEAFTRDDFGTALDSSDVKGVNDGKHARGKYLSKVLDRLNYRPHPNNPDLFLPNERVESYADSNGVDLDGPRIDLWAPEDLDDDELIRGLRIELAREAAAGNGRVEYTTAEIQGDVFDGRLSTQKVASIMESAATAAGFKAKHDDGKRISVYLPNVDDPDVWEHVDPDDADDGSGDDVDAEMSRLMAATPTAEDGGGT
jgi:hypothetical protein